MINSIFANPTISDLATHYAICFSEGQQEAVVHDITNGLTADAVAFLTVKIYQKLLFEDTDLAYTFVRMIESKCTGTVDACGDEN